MLGIDTATLTPLMERTLAEIRPDARITELKLVEMADGSGRWAVLVTVHDQEKIRFRVATPAPANAPKWAGVYTDYTRVRIADES